MLQGLCLGEAGPACPEEKNVYFPLHWYVHSHQKKKKKTVEMILSNIRADFSGTQTQSKILSWPFQLSSNLIHMKEDA